MNDLINFFDNDKSTNLNIILARSLIAFSLMLTLIFNKNEVLFHPNIYSETGLICGEYNFISIFCILSNHLFLAKLICIVILILTMLGFIPSITSILLWWIAFSLNSSATIIDGGDQVAMVISLLMIPIFIFNFNINLYKNNTNCEKRRNNYNFFKNSIGNLFFLFLILQVFVLYMQAGIDKIYTTTWYNGTALYYWFNSMLLPTNKTIVYYFNLLFKYPYLMGILTWNVIIFELLLSISFLFNKKIRKLFFAFGVLFHFGIVLIYGLFSFWLSMIAALLIFLRPFHKKNINFVKKI